MILDVYFRAGPHWLIAQTGIGRKAALALALKLEANGFETRLEVL